MIRPVRIHGIFESVDDNSNSKGLNPEEWLSKKTLYKNFIDSLNIEDKDLYNRLLEEYNDGLLFNIEFKFLMYNLGYKEEDLDIIIEKYDAGEKPFGTRDIDLSNINPNKVNYVEKDNYLNVSINPSDVINILEYKALDFYDMDEGIKRGR